MRQSRGSSIRAIQFTFDKRAELITLFVSAFLCISCSQGITENSTSRQSIDSGIEGRVFIGPGTVHARGAQDIDKPYQARITVRDSGGRPIAKVVTNEDGTFRVPLAPGTYTVIPEAPSPDRPFPYAQKQIVTILSGRFVPIRIRYDSGIR